MAQKRVKILDYKKAGKKLIGYALDPDSRPTSLAEFKADTEGVLNVPAHYKGLQFIDTSDDVLVIRMPNAERLKASQKAAAAPHKPGEDYPLPEFYEKYEHYNWNDLLAMRMADYILGDYTMSQCG